MIRPKYATTRSATVAFSIMALASFDAMAQGRRAECSDYARLAVAQHNQNVEMGCNYSGPRWSDAREAHFAWCLLSPQSIDDENRIRRHMLQDCAGQAGAASDDRSGSIGETDRAVSHYAEHPANYGDDNEGTPMRRANCDTYSQIAGVMAVANKKYGCGQNGVEWEQGNRAHYQWCMSVGRSFVQKALRYRANVLRRCFTRLGIDQD